MSRSRTASLAPADDPCPYRRAAGERCSLGALGRVLSAAVRSAWAVARRAVGTALRRKEPGNRVEALFAASEIAGAGLLHRAILDDVDLRRLRPEVGRVFGGAGHAQAWERNPSKASL